MAKRLKTKITRKVVKNQPKSTLTRKGIYLDRHDEEKVLLFVTGLLFGVGIAVGILQNIFWYGWLSAVVIVLVLFLIESRQ